MIFENHSNSDPRLHVLKAVQSGEEALIFLKRNKPDVIVMDIHMSGMDGFETSRRIMETQPVPIVVCTATLDLTEVATDFRALEAGALALVAKPVGPGHHEYQRTAAKLVETVRLMSEVKVVKRWPRTRRTSGVSSILPSKAGILSEQSCKVIAIGASTGGPPVLQTILGGLPGNIPIPVLMVQHIAAGFLPGMVEWLTQSTGFPVHIAKHGELILSGRAYLAPDSYHMGLDNSGRIALSENAAENGLRPSVAHLFRSVAHVCGGGAIGVLLTGMGKDGAEELKQLRDLGALTIAQDQATSIVHGMPGEAIKLGAAQYILPPQRIARLLADLGEKTRIFWPNTGLS